MSVTFEEVLVEAPFSNKEIQVCVVYQKRWITVSSLAKMIRFPESELHVSWVHIIKPSIPRVKTRAQHFIHIDDVGNALKICSGA